MQLALNRAGFHCHIFEIRYCKSLRIVVIFKSWEGIGFSFIWTYWFRSPVYWRH